LVDIYILISNNTSHIKQQGKPKMAAWIYNIIGLSGVMIILTAYLLLHMNKLEAKTFNYSLLNLIGSIAIMFTFIYAWNFAAFVIEVAWSAISLFGVIKYSKVNQAPTPNH
jgi:hypothetical protein